MRALSSGGCSLRWQKDARFPMLVAHATHYRSLYDDRASCIRLYRCSRHSNLCTRPLNSVVIGVLSSFIQYIGVNVRGSPTRDAPTHVRCQTLLIIETHATHATHARHAHNNLSREKEREVGRMSRTPRANNDTHDARRPSSRSPGDGDGRNTADACAVARASGGARSAHSVCLLRMRRFRPRNYHDV